MSGKDDRSRSGRYAEMNDGSVLVDEMRFARGMGAGFIHAASPSG